MEETEQVTRKGPAMPPPEVLAALAQQEVTIDGPKDPSPKRVEKTEEVKEEKSENTTSEPEVQAVETSALKAPEPAFKAPAFKPPSAPKVQEKPKEVPSCNPSGKLPSDVYKQQQQPAASKPPIDAPKFAYRPPAWSGECTDDSYKLEVLKGGKIIGAYKLAEKSTHVLGKLETCDLRLEHPSVSRYHCILQWHVQGTYGSIYSNYTSITLDQTWKLLDYGSTHGVKINKMKLKPHQYVRCCVGSGNVVHFFSF